jgi:predicted O-methyltransferase YrrM
MTLTIDEIIGTARHAHSLMDRDELAWLIKLAQQAPDGPALEVGVYCGASLIAWSLAREGRGESIGVDNWSYLDIANLKDKAAENIAWAKITARLIDADSEHAAPLIADESLAFCFIDGDHTHDYIIRDIELWTPKVMHGGIIVFHDYARRKNDCWVKPAVDQWIAKTHWPEMGLVKTTHSFRKP